MLENKNNIRRNLFEKIRKIQNLSEEEKDYLKYLLSLKENVLKDMILGCSEDDSIYQQIVHFNIYFYIYKLYKNLVKKYGLNLSGCEIDAQENYLTIFMERLYPEKYSHTKMSFPLIEYFRNPNTGEIILNVYDAFQDSDDFNDGLSSKDIKNSEFQVEILNYFNYLFQRSMDCSTEEYELSKSGYFHKNAVGIGKLYVLKKAENITINRIVERIE